MGKDEYYDHFLLPPGSVIAIQSMPEFNEGGIYEVLATHGKHNILIDVYEMDGRIQKIE
jgi:hypothetical protein